MSTIICHLLLHYWLNGHEFEQTLGDSRGQGTLVCCSPWDCKELDTTERLNNSKSLGNKAPSNLLKLKTTEISYFPQFCGLTGQFFSPTRGHSANAFSWQTRCSQVHEGPCLSGLGSGCADSQPGYLRSPGSLSLHTGSSSRKTVWTALQRGCWLPRAWEQSARPFTVLGEGPALAQCRHFRHILRSMQGSSPAQIQGQGKLTSPLGERRIFAQLGQGVFLSGSDGKESACNAGGSGSIPGLGRSLGIHSSVLDWEIHGQRSLGDYSPWSCKELDTTEQLSLEMSATVVKCTLKWCLKIYSRKLRVVSIAEWVLDKLMVINNDKKWKYSSLSISFHVCQAGCWTHYLYLLENNSEWVVLLYPSYILENWA